MQDRSILKKYLYTWNTTISAVYVCIGKWSQSGAELRVCLRILRANENNVSISFEYRISGANCARKCKHRPYLYQYKNDLYISGLVFCTWYSAVFVSTSCFVICGCVALSIVVLRRQRGCRRGCARARGQLAESASRAGLRAPGGTRGAPSYLAQGSGSSSRAAAATAAEASN